YERMRTCYIFSVLAVNLRRWRRKRAEAGRGYELRRALRARLGMAHAVNGTRLIAPQRFSIVVGAIYDCAIDPERWPEVLHEICVDLKCMLAAIYLVDLQRSHIRVSKTWNGNDEQTVREYSDDLMY